ncbi:MAG: hypothetical protein K1X29_01815 [Bdellovibrionales bacterium]|nr:hypothetical protein [Bdellovibrionales bacterium]
MLRIKFIISFFLTFTTLVFLHLPYEALASDHEAPEGLKSRSCARILRGPWEQPVVPPPPSSAAEKLVNLHQEELKRLYAHLLQPKKGAGSILPLLTSSPPANRQGSLGENVMTYKQFLLKSQFRRQVAQWGEAQVPIEDVKAHQLALAALLRNSRPSQSALERLAKIHELEVGLRIINEFTPPNSLDLNTCRIIMFEANGKFLYLVLPTQRTEGTSPALTILAGAAAHKNRFSQHLDATVKGAKKLLSKMKVLFLKDPNQIRIQILATIDLGESTIKAFLDDQDITLTAAVFQTSMPIDARLFINPGKEIKTGEFESRLFPLAHILLAVFSEKEIELLFK